MARPLRLLSLHFALAMLAACATTPTGTASHRPVRDCADCPELLIVPSGSFLMGSPEDQRGRFDDEGPVRRVTIPAALAIMLQPVTVGEFARFASESGFTASGGCNVWDANGEWTLDPDRNWQSPGFAQGPDHPVVCVSWDEGRAYAHWLSAKTGKSYRFLTEAEFEYAARAGVAGPYPWPKDDPDFCAFANGFDRAAVRDHPDWDSPPCDDGYAFTAPVRHHPANAFGLFGMTGNVFQWVEDCFVEGGYAAAPRDGSARQADPCKARVIRGGSWANGPRGLRFAMRDRDPQSGRYSNIGLRLVRPVQ